MSRFGAYGCHEGPIFPVVAGSLNLNPEPWVPQGLATFLKAAKESMLPVQPLATASVPQRCQR